MDNYGIDKELLENVRFSTENALKALTFFEQSLVKGRFIEGTGSYATMCKTLLGQRLWSMDHNNPAIEDNFQKISTVAQNIINMLKPYVQNLEKLAVFEESDLSTENESHNIDATCTEKVDHDEKRLLEIIRKHPGNQISYTNLRASLGWERKKLDEVISSTAKNFGAISINTSGSRKMITINK